MNRAAQRQHRARNGPRIIAHPPLAVRGAERRAAPGGELRQPVARAGMPLAPALRRCGDPSAASRGERAWVLTAPPGSNRWNGRLRLRRRPALGHAAARLDPRARQPRGGGLEGSRLLLPAQGPAGPRLRPRRELPHRLGQPAGSATPTGSSSAGRPPLRLQPGRARGPEAHAGGPDRADPRPARPALAAGALQPPRGRGRGAGRRDLRRRRLRQLGRSTASRRRGEHLGSWGAPGAGPGQFTTPHGIWVDAHERVLVADRENNRVQLFSPEGDFYGEWARSLSPDGHLRRPARASSTSPTRSRASAMYAPDGATAGPRPAGDDGRARRLGRLAGRTSTSPRSAVNQVTKLVRRQRAPGAQPTRAWA